MDPFDENKEEKNEERVDPTEETTPSEPTAEQRNEQTPGPAPESNEPSRPEIPPPPAPSPCGSQACQAMFHQQQQWQRPTPPPRKKSSMKWVILIVVFIMFGAFCFTGLLFIGMFAKLAGLSEGTPMSGEAAESAHVRKTVLRAGNSSNIIAVVDVKGIIANGIGVDGADSARICSELRAAANHHNVRAIVLDMNTPGGEVTASDEIYHEILRLRSNGIPVITCIRSMGASGGYFVAAGSDYIVSNRLSLTGSVGVIMGTMNYTELFKKVGLKSEVYKSGKMKDMLNVARERTQQETKYVNEMIGQTFHEFAKIVAAGRETYADAEAVKSAEFGDGRVLSGADAYRLGLVDELGYFEDAVEVARKLGDAYNPQVVRFSRQYNFLDILFSMEEKAGPAKVELLPKEMQIVKPGRLYYLAPSVIHAE